MHQRANASGMTARGPANTVLGSLTPMTGRNATKELCLAVTPRRVAGCCVAGVPGSEAGEGRSPVPAQVAARGAASGGGPGEVHLQARFVAVRLLTTFMEVATPTPSMSPALRPRTHFGLLKRMVGAY